MIRETGRYETTVAGGEQVRAFIPYRLPPADPPLCIEGNLAKQLQAAEQALNRLEFAGQMIPSIDWFLYAFVRKEAVLSSQIEGTQATLVDLFAYENQENQEAFEALASHTTHADIEEVCNHIDALQYARKQLADPKGLPLSMRLLNQTHAILLRGVRGAGKLPGEVRRSQNWIGGSRPGNARYVPPPPHMLGDILSEMERYIYSQSELPPLVRAGLLHVQFETIHPYLDGNGRMGRLLLSLLLEHWQILRQPLLYLSLFFKRHQQEYYQRLNAVRVDGDWEGWLDFFCQGVANIAEEAVATAKELSALIAEDRARLIHQSKTTLLAMQIFEQLPHHPILSTAWVVQNFQTTKPTANRAIEPLVLAGILVETTGKKRDRSYAYQRYLDQLKTETEL